MDAGFRPVLSDYSQTRDDVFWGRHIHFRKPFQYYYGGLYQPSLGWGDIEPYRIGNGIDKGRSVLGLRLETTLFDKSFENLFDVRNVHKSDGKFVENAARDEVSIRATDQLSAKLLGIFQKMHKTAGGLDPFILDNETDLPLINTAIEEGKDPSLKSGSFGLEYAFTQWLALSGVWERTNDSTLAYDNFPRGDLNGSSLGTFNEFDMVFRRDIPFLFNQALFPLPPINTMTSGRQG